MTTDYRLRAKSNPILPDSDSGRPRPHPDGRAWLKSCDECAFRRCDPQELGDNYQERLRHYDGKSVFYCLHRTTHNRHRICASYAAINDL